MKSIVAAVLLFFCAATNAAEPFTAEGVRVVDGDTLHVDVLHLGWGVSLVDVTIRAADFDAWETSRARRTVEITDDEIAKGKRATLFLARLLRERRFRITPAIGRDRDVYGRLLAIVTIVDDEPPMRPLAELMRDGGHCRSTPPR